MTDPQAATATQLRNIEARTGQSLRQLHKLIQDSGLSSHAQQRAMLMERLSLGYGDANALAHAAKALAASPSSAAPAAAAADRLDAIYSGAKAHLRPLHERLTAAIERFGAFESAPKKTYVSLRRNKQFATLGPATRDSLELGLNAKGLPADARLKVIPPGGMCQYSVRIGQAAEIDAALLGWLRSAFDAAG